jgi:hypothetical protein
MAMHESNYGGPGSFALVTISVIFAWISQLTMDQIAFVISAISGLMASISFSIRIRADMQRKAADDASIKKKDTGEAGQAQEEIPKRTAGNTNGDIT